MIFSKFFHKKNDKTLPLWRQSKSEYFNFDLIGYYFKNKSHFDTLQIISDRITDDIDFDELFMSIDRTHSKPGQQYYYNQLLNIRSNIDFERQEKRIEYFIENERIRLKIQSLLSKLDTKNDYYVSNLFLDEYLSKPKWFIGIKILSLLAFVLLVLALLYNKTREFIYQKCDSDT